MNQHNRKCLSLNLSLIFPFVWGLSNFMVQSLWPQTPALGKHPLGMTLTGLVDLPTCHTHEPICWEVILQRISKAIQNEIFLLHQFTQSKEWCLLFGMCIVLQLNFTSIIEICLVTIFSFESWGYLLSFHVNSVPLYNFSFFTPTSMVFLGKS